MSYVSERYLENTTLGQSRVLVLSACSWCLQSISWLAPRSVTPPALSCAHGCSSSSLRPQHEIFPTLRLSHSWSLCPLSSRSTASCNLIPVIRRAFTPEGTFIIAGQQYALALFIGRPGHSRNLSFAFRVSTTCAWHRRIHIRLFHFVQDLTYKHQARSVRKQLVFPLSPSPPSRL